MSDVNKKLSEENVRKREDERKEKIIDINNKIEYLKILYESMDQCISKEDIDLAVPCLIIPCIKDINEELKRIVDELVIPLPQQVLLGFKSGLLAAKLKDKGPIYIVLNFERWLNDLNTDMDRWNLFYSCVYILSTNGETSSPTIYNIDEIIYIYNIFLNYVSTHIYKVRAMFCLVDLFSMSDNGLNLIRGILRPELLDNKYVILLLEKIFYNYKGNFNEKTQIALEIINEVKNLEYFIKCVCLILGFIYINYSENNVKFNDVKNILYKLKYLIEQKMPAEIQPKKVEIVQKPSVDVTLSRTNFEPNVWTDARITIRNTGKVNVRDIRIEIENAEYEILSTPSVIKPSEAEDVKCLLKFTKRGKVPLKINVSYKDVEGENYRDTKIVTVNVETRKVITETGFPEQLLSKYEPIELLGEGGFAHVWKCRRKEDGLAVAVKIPKPSEEAGESFISELSNWKKLKHNNIVDLHDYNVFPYPYIEMELCDKTLKDCKFKMNELLKVAYAIADALRYAHSKGIVHGDLKPSNILLKDNTPKLSDWGMGYTPAYSPPEVLLGEKPDEKADIWSFGVVLYELIKGYNPFQGIDDIETMDKVLEFEPDFSNLGVFEDIIRRCLQKERDKRFSSMDEVKKELAKINLANFSKSFSMSKSKRDRVYSASEIISTYICEGNFKLAKDRLNSVKKLNIMPLKIADAMLTVIEIMEKCDTEVTLDFLERKYAFILDLLNEHREEIEKSENIGILFRKVMLHQSGNVISDDERELIKNVFCKALLEKIKLLAYKSVEERV